MENELSTLEGKLAQLIKLSSQLHTENLHLRQELAHTLASNRLCNDKIDAAKTRLESLLPTLSGELL
jgi:cell division protein ZapB